MQMDRKHLTQRLIQRAAHFQSHLRRPLSARSVGFERVRKPIVQATGTRIVETKGEDFERGSVRCQEPTPEFEIEEGPPVGGAGARRGGRGHDVKGFT